MKKQAMNPVLPIDTYIPDGEPHVFGDRLYLFGSHDKEAGETFCMLDYQGWSAPIEDLSDWTCSGNIYSPSQDPRYDPVTMPYAFAPDVVQGNDGRFYLYYCLAGQNGKGGYSNPISVAVCDTPDGQYEFYGYVKNQFGKLLEEYVCFDPAVINDDGQIRLYFGAHFPFDTYRNRLNNPLLDRIESKILGIPASRIRESRKKGDSVTGSFHVTLSDDMLTATTDPTRVLATKTKGTRFESHAFFEGSSIRKIGEKYYFIYSTQNNHELCYATSYYPDKGFEFGGIIVSNGDVGFNGRSPEKRMNNTGTNHGSIECIKGQWYIFYHRLTHLTDFSRQAMAEPISIGDNGDIAQVEMTSSGLNIQPLQTEARYPAVIACNITNGKMPHGRPKSKKNKLPHISSYNGQRFINDITNGTLIGFKYFDFVERKYTIIIRTKGIGVGTLYIGTDSKVSEKITENFVKEISCGTIQLTTSNYWKRDEVTCSLQNGAQPLYFVFFGKGTFQLLDFEFIKGEKDE